MISFVFRVVLLLIAISAIKSVVNYGRRLWHSFQSGSAPVRNPPRTSAETTSMQQDPVCGTYVSVATSLKRIVSGQVWHFCSEECRDRFRP